MNQNIRDNISKNVRDNVKYIKELLKDNSDVVYREFYTGKYEAALVYIDGMADKALLDNFVMETLMVIGNNVENVNEIKEKILTVSDMRQVDKLNEVIDAFLAGETALFLEGLQGAYIVATRMWPTRGISEPAAETSVRGARESFSETMRFNTALVRRRIRDTRLRIKAKVLGARSKTDTTLLYIEDIVNKDVLEELEKRLDKIKIDAVLDSGPVGQLIEDSKWTIFPLYQSTERPDVVAAALYEGRVAVLVDNSPYAIIVPGVLPSMFQTPDDYYQTWLHGSLIRLIRLIGVFISIVGTPIYVAVTAFHPSIIPTKLTYSIAATRESVPFPAIVEAFIMEISLALLIEAVVRLPKSIGTTIGIVGGVVIGQAAVTAGIISPIMLIIVSATAIATFITPNYEITYAFRVIRYLLLFAANIVGLYGIMLGIIVLLIHLSRLKSFGIPYLSPIVNPSIGDFKDLFIRSPYRAFKERPRFMDTGDKVRQK